MLATVAEYEEFADWFLEQPLSLALRQFTRPWNGDVARYDETRDVFAILDNDGFIKTCYRPDFFFHGAATNLEYYLEEEEKAT
jgi:pyocin large subunit-like protein